MCTIDISKVQSVYVGRVNKCCCGCSGKHTYASALRDVASKSRGYTVDDDEVNDVQVACVVNMIEQAEVVEGDMEYLVTVNGKTQYVAYMVEA